MDMFIKKMRYQNLLLFLCTFLFPATLNAQQGPIPVTFQKVVKRPIQETVTLPGTVTARNLSSIATEVSGRVLRVLVDIGDTVKRGQTLVQLDTTALEIMRDSITAQLDESKARLELARLQLNRIKSLFESGQGIVSVDQLDEARYEFQAREAQVHRLNAELKRLNHDIERSTIRAPFTGSITNRFVSPGEWVQVGDPIVEIFDPETLLVVVDVPENRVGQIRPDTPAIITIDALPDLEIRSKVRRIARRAAPEARTFPAFLPLNNQDPRIGISMLATVRFSFRSQKEALFVPKDAIVRQGNRDIVFVIDGKNVVQMVPVRTGVSEGIWVAVEGNLKEGDRVVTRGNERLRPGIPVIPRPDTGGSP